MIEYQKKTQNQAEKEQKPTISSLRNKRRERFDDFVSRNPAPHKWIQANHLYFFSTGANVQKYHLTELDVQILNVLLGLSNNMTDIYPTQEYLSRKCNCTTRKVRDSLNKLETWGFITTFYRHHRPSLFKVSYWFHQTKVRDSLKHILWSLKYFPIAMLLSVCSAMATDNIQTGSFLHKQYNIYTQRGLDCQARSSCYSFNDSFYLKNDDGALRNGSKEPMVSANGWKPVHENNDDSLKKDNATTVEKRVMAIITEIFPLETKLDA